MDNIFYTYVSALLTLYQYMYSIKLVNKDGIFNYQNIYSKTPQNVRKNKP